MKTLYSLVTLALLAAQSYISSVRAQTERIPEFYIQMTAPATDLQQRITEAAEHTQSDLDERRFWYGYRFELRPDIDFHDIYIQDDGGITISRGDGWFLYEDEDPLDLHALRALSGMGDEEARKALEERRRDFIRDHLDDWGVFVLVDAESRELRQIKLFSFRGREKFRDYPVFWFGKLDTDVSLKHVKQIIDDDRHQKRIVEPALFVLSLHQHPQVAPMLADIAASDRHLDLRKSAAFWLGHIPGEESLNRLVQIYDDEQNPEMKEKLIFGISQHDSEKSINKLETIAREETDIDLQEKAVFWLGQKEADRALKILQKLLRSDQHRRLKEKVIFAISQHESERAVPILIETAESDPDRDLREKAIFWLGQKAGKKTLEVLGGIVENDEDTEIKNKAVFAISQHGDREQAVEMLMDIARNNGNPEVRKKAIFWLSQSGDEKALEFFKEILVQE